MSTGTSCSTVRRGNLEVSWVQQHWFLIMTKFGQPMFSGRIVRGDLGNNDWQGWANLSLLTFINFGVEREFWRECVYG